MKLLTTDEKKIITNIEKILSELTENLEIASNTGLIIKIRPIDLNGFHLSIKKSEKYIDCSISLPLKCE